MARRRPGWHEAPSPPGEPPSLRTGGQPARGLPSAKPADRSALLEEDRHVPLASLAAVHARPHQAAPRGTLAVERAALVGVGGELIDGAAERRRGETAVRAADDDEIGQRDLPAHEDRVRED